MVVLLVAVGIFAWWYAGYSKDKASCEDRVLFRGSTMDGYYCYGGLRGSDTFRTCGSGAFESREQAVNDCMNLVR